MFWTILVVLVALWLVGVVTSHTLGGLIHALPVVALLLLCVRLASGAVEASMATRDGVAASAPDPGTRQSIVYLSGVSDTEAFRRETGRVAWRSAGADRAAKDRTVARSTVGSWVDDAKQSAESRSERRVGGATEAWEVVLASAQGTLPRLGRVGAAPSEQDAQRIVRGVGSVKAAIDELRAGRSRS